MISIGFYKRQFLFFLILFPFLIYGGYLISRQFSSASVTDVPNSNISANNFAVDIELKADGTTLINGQKSQKLVQIGEDKDLFRYIAASEEGFFIDAIEVRLHLPKAVKKEEIRPYYYAVHGVSGANVFQLDEKTLVYQANDLAPAATFTAVADLPQGVIEFPFLSRFSYSLANMDAYNWLAVSFLPFLLTLLYLFILYWRGVREWRLPKVKEVLESPPDQLSPAEVAVLVEGKISNRAISAIILDLAQRNYLNIAKKEEDFVFVKKRGLELRSLLESKDLRNYEKILLDKIFSQQYAKTSKADILFRVSHHVFSRKIAQVYVDIYETINSRGYFSKDPAKMHLNYRSFGLMMFFIAFMGLMAGLFLSIEPKFFLVFWLMMLFTAMLIIKMSNFITFKNQAGQQAVLKWLAFKNYLTSQEPINVTVGKSELLQKYLPYAVALGCEVEWSKRFTFDSFVAPEWYISMEPVYSLHDLTQGLFPIIGYVSKLLVESREPII